MAKKPIKNVVVSNVLRSHFSASNRVRSLNEIMFGLTLGVIANVHHIFLCATLEAVLLLVGFNDDNHVKY